MPGTQQPQFDGENAVSGYTLFHGKDGKSYYLKGENLADADITQRVQKLRSAQPPDTGTDIADLQRRTLQQARNYGGKPLNNAVSEQNFVDSMGQIPGTHPSDPSDIPAVRAVQGVKEIGRGNVSKGAHQVIGAVGDAATPTLPLIFPMAPAATALGLAGSAAGGYLGKNAAPIFGATPDQADL